MSSFDYQEPVSLAGAIERLGRAGAVPLGGGTDLIPLWRESRVAIAEVVKLRRIAGLTAIEPTAEGGVMIGAAVTLTEIAASTQVQRAFPVLASACSAVGSLQLRNMGTIGGNLCQRPRCWYFRHGHECLKTGGSTCSALAGENQYHAVFRSGRCVAAHPSDPAVALMALDALVHVAGPSGSRRLTMDEFFDVAPELPEGETALNAGEMVTAVELPAQSASGMQYFEKVIQRGAWDFALTSVAGVRRTNGDVRLVLGGVASRPWRVRDSIEEDVASGGLSRDDIETLAERALYDATPLAHNSYKLTQAKALLRRAIESINA